MQDGAAPHIGWEVEEFFCVDFVNDLAFQEVSECFTSSFSVLESL